MWRQVYSILSILVIMFLTQPTDVAAANYPTKPIKVIVPFAAGGQGDVFARMIIKRIEEKKLLSQPLIVVNVPGGGATIGIRRAHKAKPDGQTLLFIHQTLMTAQLTGKLKFKYTDFQPIAETNKTCLLTATANGSGIKSAKDWISQAKAKPKGLKEATLLGSAAFFTTAMMNKAAGMQVGFVNAGGGAKRIASILGNHTKTAVLVAAPVTKNPKLQALVYYGEKRNKKLPNTPTAKELGYDVVSCLNNVWWAPAGVSSEVVGTLSKVFTAAMSDKTLIETIEKRGQTVELVTGEPLKTRLADIYARLSAVAPKR